MNRVFLCWWCCLGGSTRWCVGKTSHFLFRITYHPYNPWYRSQLSFLPSVHPVVDVVLLAHHNAVCHLYSFGLGVLPTNPGNRTVLEQNGR